MGPDIQDWRRFQKKQETSLTSLTRGGILEEKLDRLCQGSEMLEGEQAERPSPDISPQLLGPIMNDQSHGQPTPLGPGPTGT